VNFADGANPPRSGWRLQPQLSHAQSEHAFQYFEALIHHIKSLPNVRFITATEALALYRDAAQSRTFEPNELAEIAAQVTPQVSFQTHKRYTLSASEVFALLNSVVAKTAGNKSSEPIALQGTPYGPSSAAFNVESNQASEVSWSQFSRTVLDVDKFIHRNSQIPNAIWMGSAAVSPESYLLALASVASALLLKQPPPESVKIVQAELAAGQWVAKDSLSIWNWPIFPPGFHAPHLMELARLQAWTLKPALLPAVK